MSDTDSTPIPPSDGGARHSPERMLRGTLGYEISRAETEGDWKRAGALKQQWLMHINENQNGAG